MFTASTVHPPIVGFVTTARVGEGNCREVDRGICLIGGYGIGHGGGRRVIGRTVTARAGGYRGRQVDSCFVVTSGQAQDPEAQYMCGGLMDHAPIKVPK